MFDTNNKTRNNNNNDEARPSNVPLDPVKSITHKDNKIPKNKSTVNIKSLFQIEYLEIIKSYKVLTRSYKKPDAIITTMAR